MTDYSDELRFPIAIQVQLPLPTEIDRLSHEPIVNHPANGWSRNDTTATRSPAELMLNAPDIALNEFSRPNADRVAELAEQGVVVRLPNGTVIPDEKSSTGAMMGPTSDLRPVARAGRKLNSRLDREITDPNPGIQSGAFLDLALTLNAEVGQGGEFDYQRRRANIFQEYTQLRQFRSVSNFNVGLFCQQAGLSLSETLRLAGLLARMKSSNYRPDQPFGLDPKTREYIEVGFASGASGMYEDN